MPQLPFYTAGFAGYITLETMRLLLLLFAFGLVACASTLEWPSPDEHGGVNNEAMAMIRKRFETGVDPSPSQSGEPIAIDLALAARGGIDKRAAVLAPPKTQVKFVDPSTILVKVSFSRSIGYGTNYLEQFHVVARNRHGEWKHLTYFETVTLEMRH